jgi:hypothetical protein
MILFLIALLAQLFRRVSLSPDQSASTAQTLISTKPVASAAAIVFYLLTKLQMSYSMSRLNPSLRPPPESTIVQGNVASEANSMGCT